MPSWRPSENGGRAVPCEGGWLVAAEFLTSILLKCPTLTSRFAVISTTRAVYGCGTCVAGIGLAGYSIFGYKTRCDKDVRPISKFRLAR